MNDETPRFWREQYESFLEENTDTFQTPLVIQAEDRDENGQLGAGKLAVGIYFFPVF